MPGGRLTRTRSGDTAEYFAQCYLSALGLSAPVPRQEDIGIDFYCVLGWNEIEDSDILVFRKAYTVQVGLRGGKMFAYGGVKKSGRWKRWQIHWLFEQEKPPFFIGLVDKDKGSFDLYATSPMWRVRNEKGFPCKVILAPDDLRDPSKDICSLVPNAPKDLGDRNCYTIPLGKPAVSLQLQNLTRSDTLLAAKVDLSKAIDVEERNRAYRMLNTFYFEWIKDYRPDPMRPGLYELQAHVTSNTRPGEHTAKQLLYICPILLALARNYKMQGKKEELCKLRGIGSLLHDLRDDAPMRLLKREIPELFEDDLR